MEPTAVLRLYKSQKIYLPWGHLKHSLDKQTKELSYHILDWVLQCSGAECTSGAVYATQGYDFLCMPRSITQHLVDTDMTFREADAWLDLWCHTTFEDYRNALSFLAPSIQYGKFGAVLTLESFGNVGAERKSGYENFSGNTKMFFHHSICRVPTDAFFQFTISHWD